MAWRSVDQASAKRAIVAARRTGLTLAKASAAAGVHVATVCRWQAADRKFRRELQQAAQAARQERTAQHVAEYLARLAARRRRVPPRNPVVPVHPCCPRCGRLSETRRAFRLITFWRCSLWPWCGWASWRPRHPRDCPACGGLRYWSWSRMSVSCPACNTREWVEWGSGTGENGLAA